MVKEIYHVGLTVKSLEESISFYKDILGLRLEGEATMSGREAEILFQMPNVKVRLAYLNGSDKLAMPPVELIEFEGLNNKANPSLFEPSISELCFRVNDIDALYRHLISHNVYCLSAPQEFDFRKSGLGKSKAFYFKDPNGIILEAMEIL